MLFGSKKVRSFVESIEIWSDNVFKAIRDWSSLGKGRLKERSSHDFVFIVYSVKVNFKGIYVDNYKNDKKYNWDSI